MAAEGGQVKGLRKTRLPDSENQAPQKQARPLPGPAWLPSPERRGRLQAAEAVVMVGTDEPPRLCHFQPQALMSV